MNPSTICVDEERRGVALEGAEGCDARVRGGLGMREGGEEAEPEHEGEEERRASHGRLTREAQKGVNH